MTRLRRGARRVTEIPGELLAAAGWCAGAGNVCTLNHLLDGAYASLGAERGPRE